MKQPAGHHLAEFNFGVLTHEFEHPKIADFTNNIDRVNAVAARSVGFVWRMTDEDMEAAQHDPLGVLGGNPRVASTLSVWRDAQSLLTFVFNTVHKQFYDRASEWFTPGISGKMVLWWVPEGTRPGIEEAVARYEHWTAEGDTDFAFGWTHLQEARPFLASKQRIARGKP